MPDQSHQRAKARSVTWRPESRPWRVVPLALLAVVATSAAMEAAKTMFWNASKHRYADDILRKDLRQVHVGGVLKLR